MKKKATSPSAPNSVFNLSRFAERYFLFGLVVIAAFAFITRIWRLNLPETYMFDEVYHAVTAKLIAHNDYRAFDWYAPPPEPNTAVDWLHPPLAKYTQALSMLIFGENSFGWRFSSVLAGTAVVVMTGVLAQKLFKRPIIAWLAALLTALDGLLLAQSRIAMNDIHVTLAILAAIWFYLKAQPLSSQTAAESKPAELHHLSLAQQARTWLAVGLAAGIAMGTKWSGVFVLAIIGLREAWWTLSRYPVILNWSLAARRRFAALTIIKLLMLLVVPIATYFASYTMFFTQGRNLADFKELHRQIWTYQTSLEATHPFQSRPYQWWLNLRPVWIYVNYPPQTATSPRPPAPVWLETITGTKLDPNLVANIYAFGNPLLFWLGDVAVIMTLILIITQSLKFATLTTTQRQELPALQLALLTYALVWLPWVTSPRIMFFYHYSPAVPWLAILLAYWLGEGIRSSSFNTSEKIILVGLPIALIALCFVIWYPHWTGIPVPLWWANEVYFSLSSWK